jgi:hypothetical protein
MAKRKCRRRCPEVVVAAAAASGGDAAAAEEREAAVAAEMERKAAAATLTVRMRNGVIKLVESVRLQFLLNCNGEFKYMYLCIFVELFVLLSTLCLETRTVNSKICPLE